MAQAILARRVVAPYGVESLLLTLIWKWAAVGRRYLPLRAQRALKGMGLIDKKGKTVGVSLLVRSVAAQATISARDGQAHTFPR